MIKLMNPRMPSMQEISRIYSNPYKTGVHSNFGELFYEATKFLSDKSGRECLPVSTGTAAIEIACRLQFKKKSRILVPDYTHAGTLHAIVAAECIPILVKTDEKSWVISEKDIKDHSKNIDGVVIVSPFGYYVNVTVADQICEKLKLPVVYDFAGAWGAFPATKNPVCYSLHATKNFSCGEGGIVSVKTKTEWQRALWFSNFCNDPDRVVRSLDGRNHKPSELLCAVILAHKKTYQEIFTVIEHKKRVIRDYCNALDLNAPYFGNPSLCVVEGLTAVESQKLLDLGVENKQYYTPFPLDICKSYSRTSQEKVLSRYALPSENHLEVIKCIKKIRQNR